MVFQVADENLNVKGFLTDRCITWEESLKLQSVLNKLLRVMTQLLMVVNQFVSSMKGTNCVQFRKTLEKAQKLCLAIMQFVIFYRLKTSSPETYAIRFNNFSSQVTLNEK
jgi:uncharacterized membrane protein YbjE (DUF340 family)